MGWGNGEAWVMKICNKFLSFNPILQADSYATLLPSTYIKLIIEQGETRQNFKFITWVAGIFWPLLARAEHQRPSWDPAGLKGHSYHLKKIRKNVFLTNFYTWKGPGAAQSGGTLEGGGPSGGRTCWTGGGQAAGGGRFLAARGRGEHQVPVRRILRQ